MGGMEKASLIKERIISIIKQNGPSLPVHIARSLNISQLFTGAFLSELYNEHSIKMSNMRVGSSPLYLIEGQEAQLEKFIEHLANKEREAFLLLKNNKFLKDDEQSPAIRVALRSIKDFAIPFNQKSEEGDKIIWKYFTITENEINETLKPKKDIPLEVKKEEIIEIKKDAPKKIEIKEEIFKEPLKKEKKKKPSTSDSDFIEKMKNYLLSKEIEIINLFSDKRKDFSAKVRIDTLLGKQEFLLMVKDKKKINEEDISLAVHKAQSEKLPGIIMSSGEIDKKAIEYYNSWKNLL